MAPDIDSTVPIGDTCMMIDPALWTRERKRVSRPLATSKRRRSVKSRRHNRTTFSPNQRTVVPTISTRRQPRAAWTRISMGDPTSLP